MLMGEIISSSFITHFVFDAKGGLPDLLSTEALKNGDRMPRMGYMPCWSAGFFTSI